ncbi:MAG: nucleoside hydrolase-like domain-containing protein [Phycisphaerales bacterium]
MKKSAMLSAALLGLSCCVAWCDGQEPNNMMIRPRHRVIVSTDIGGTDPDDLQSMVHLLVYADCFDIEGLISSPYGPGRKEHILRVIHLYERDYANLKTYSDKYPAPDALRAIAKQGSLEGAGYAGFGSPTEGSDWIVQCARRDDPRPLWVLVWGGIDDLARALHDAPDILPKLRVYFIGGPNKKWSVDAYQYIATHHPTLWIIEANATYRGWFVGGNQEGEWGNKAFVAAHIAGHGALGDFFATLLGGTIKMGDSPSVGYLLHGTPEDPSQPGWGGQFVRAWEQPHVLFRRLTDAEDQIEQFGVFELALPLGERTPERPEATLVIENQSSVGSVGADGTMRFRFSPKDAKTYRYVIRSNVPGLDGKAGALTSVRPVSEAAQRPSPRLPNWWTDDPSLETAEGPHIGARTVSRWREDFLRDFAERMDRCKSP